MVLCPIKLECLDFFKCGQLKTAIPAHLKDRVECGEGEATFSHHSLNGEGDEPVTKTVDESHYDLVHPCHFILFVLHED